jgi:hypothetical protein
MVRFAIVNLTLRVGLALKLGASRYRERRVEP